MNSTVTIPIHACPNCIIGDYCGANNIGESASSCTISHIRNAINDALKSKKNTNINTGRISEKGNCIGLLKSLISLITKIKSLDYSNMSEDDTLGKLLVKGSHTDFEIVGFCSYLLFLNRQVTQYHNQDDPRVIYVREFLVYWVSKLNSHIKENGTDEEIHDKVSFLNGCLGIENGEGYSHVA